MDTPTARPAKFARLRALAAPAGIALAAASAVVAVTTGAVFTSSTNVGANNFVTGTVSIGSTPSTAAVALAGVAPGDSVVAPVTINNTGSLQQRYSMTSSFTGTLTDLQLTVKSGVTTCTSGGFASTGAVLYGPGTLNGGGGNAVFGSAAQGAQAGDRVLNGGASEVLCVKAELPLASTQSGLTQTATFTFNAEQTVNN